MTGHNPSLPPGLSRRGFLALGTLASAGALTACSGGESSGQRRETLYVGGWQWGTPPNHNPLSPTAGWPIAANQMPIVYESLLRFDQLDGALLPGLATGLATPDETTITVTLHSGAAWHDGKPVTAQDVVFTYQLAKRHEDLWYSNVWDHLTDVTAPGADTVAFALDPDNLNPAIVKHHIASVYILPRHLWERIERENERLLEYPNRNPVGSGPYRIKSYNAQRVVLERHDAYWGKSARGGLPAPKTVIHPIFKDNASADLAFERGEVDVMQSFTPQIWKMWESKNKPVGTWHEEPPYHIPGSIPMLVLNTTKKGLDDPRVRRALAFSIDYAHIAETAMSRYSEPVRSSVVIPAGSEEKYFDGAAVAEHGWRHDPDEARRILEEELKATKGGDGVYRLPDGTRLSFGAQCPTGWSDWQTALRSVADSAKKVGIELKTTFPQAPQVTTAVQNGTFEVAVWYVSGTSPAAPWQRFRDVLDMRGVSEPGSPAYYNYGRFSHPEAADLLDRVARVSDDEAKAKELYGRLDRIFMEHAPMIPLMYRPLDFFEFNESVWKNFPDAANPYAPPMWRGAGDEWLYKIKAAGA
ncbi:ABC transporter substrate-binding protein [Streptomyces capparidis]